MPRPTNLPRFRIGIQTSLIILYPKSLVEKVKHVNDVKLTGKTKVRLNWIKHCYSYPRTPKTNGNVERVIRTIEEELWFIEDIDYHVDHLNALLRRYIDKYNFIRPHYALGHRTPGEIAYPDKENKSGVIV